METLTIEDCVICGRRHEDLIIFEIPNEVDMIVEWFNEEHNEEYRKFVVCPFEGQVIFYTKSFLETEG